MFFLRLNILLLVLGAVQAQAQSIDIKKLNKADHADICFLKGRKAFTYKIFKENDMLYLKELKKPIK